eukprot:SAG11_NODE_18538_length_488_cov_0.907455_1_plen_40_part_10
MRPVGGRVRNLHAATHRAAAAMDRIKTTDETDSAQVRGPV